MGLLKQLQSIFSQRASRDERPSEPTPDLDDSANDIDPFNPFPAPVVVEFTDVLDLHYIPPKQIKAVVEDFLAEAERRNYRYIRIIHGKGISVQRERVRSILARTPFVLEFSDAPPEAGGWGATVAELQTERLTDSQVSRKVGRESN